MKKLILTSCIAMAVLAATQTFALEIRNGKITSHKEWTTGNAKAIFKNTSLPISKSKVTSRDGESAAIDLDVVHGAVGQPVTWMPRTYAYHHNIGQESETVTYLVSVCTALTENDTDCSHYYDVVELAPGGEMFGGATPEMTTTFDKAGSYPIYATVQINGDAQIVAGAESRVIVADGKK